MCITFVRSPSDVEICIIHIDHQPVCWLYKEDFEQIKALMGWD